MRRLFIIIILIVTVSCSSSTQAPASAPVSRPPLRIGWIVWPGWYPIIIAQEKGFFAKHNVRVEAKLYSLYSEIPADFAANNIDGSLIGLYDMLSMPSADQARVVLVTDTSDGAEGLIAVNTIRQAQDLKGKRVGVVKGSIGEFFLHRFLADNAMSINDVQLFEMDPETVATNMPGAIDAGYTWEPHISQAASQRNVVLASTADITGLVPDVLMVRDSVVRDRADDVRGFVAAWFEAVIYWQQNLAECNAIIAKQLNMQPSEISTQGVKLFTQVDNNNAFTQGNSLTSLYYTAKTQLSFIQTYNGVNTNLDINQLLDPSFITSATK